MFDLRFKGFDSPRFCSGFLGKIDVLGTEQRMLEVMVKEFVKQGGPKGDVEPLRNIPTSEGQVLPSCATAWV